MVAKRVCTLVLLTLVCLAFVTPVVTVHAAPPPNDDIANATIITSLPYHDRVDVMDATWDDPGTDHCYDGGNVWYAYTATEHLFFRATAESPYWTHIDVYSGAQGNLTHITCGDVRVEFGTAPGVTYYLMFSGGNGELELVANGYTPPPNDNIANAKEITALPYTDSLDVTYATWDSPGPDVYACIMKANVWYKYTPSETHYVGITFPVPNGGYWHDGMYRGAPGSLEIVGCDDGRYLVEAGQTYYLMLDGGGVLNLTVDDLGPPISIDLAVLPVGLVDPRTGAATIYGQVRTSRLADVWISGELRQKRGRKTIITGSFGMTVSCDGRATWSAVVHPNQGAYALGPVEVVATAEAGDWFGYDETQVTQMVFLAVRRR